MRVANQIIPTFILLYRGKHARLLLTSQNIFDFR